MSKQETYKAYSFGEIREFAQEITPSPDYEAGKSFALSKAIDRFSAECPHKQTCPYIYALGKEGCRICLEKFRYFRQPETEV